MRRALDKAEVNGATFPDAPGWRVFDAMGVRASIATDKHSIGE